jgi:hypothetical protein
MSASDRPEPAADDGVVFDTKPACMALVPMVHQVPWSQNFGQPMTRPNSTFVTHLIATAEQVPQTRSLRRATPADAQNAYAANRQLQRTGFRTRQVVQA